MMTTQDQQLRISADKLQDLQSVTLHTQLRKHGDLYSLTWSSHADVSLQQEPDRDIFLSRGDILNPFKHPRLTV